MLKAVDAVHRSAFRPRHPDATSRSPVATPRSHRLSPTGDGRRSQGLDLQAAADLLPPDDTDPNDVGVFRDGVFTGVKLYPANATTNSAAGVTAIAKVMQCWNAWKKSACRS